MEFLFHAKLIFSNVRITKNETHVLIFRIRLLEVKILKKNEKQNSIVEGVSIGITFIIVGVILLFLPDYFRNETVTNALAYVSIFFGMFGLGIELNKLNGDAPKIGLDDFALGIAFIVLWIWLYSSFDYLLVNILILFILLLGIFSTILGTIRFGSGIFQSENKKSVATKIGLTLINVITALAVIYEALQKFGIIDSLAK